MIVVGMVAALMIIALPGFLRAREKSRQTACQDNLLRIDGAIQQYIIETSTPGFIDLGPMWPSEFVGTASYIRSMPRCPSQGTYTVTYADAYQPVVCSYQNEEFPHVLEQVQNDESNGS